MLSRLLLAATVALLLAGASSCSSLGSLFRGGPTDGYYDLADFGRAVTTEVAEAQRWFDRGLTLTYGFNHEEAIRCFERAIEADPGFALAWWGIAHASGPYVNNRDMDDARNEAAWQASERARALSRGCTALERDLIGTLESRFVWPAPAERRLLDEAYVEAMRDVHERYPEDADIAAIFAESLMMLSPWKYWQADGTPIALASECRNVLEAALLRSPDHPGLCHFYIHLMESSPWPEVALPAADALRDRIPEAGHLRHMPAHIDILVGQYAESIAANERAIAADRLFVEREGRVNFYTLYRIHNYHFLVYGAMFDGRRELALSAARELVTEVPQELLEEIPDFLEAFLPTVYHAMVRFGMWQEILDEPQHPQQHYFSRAIRHYARTVALSSLNRVDEAAAELELLRRAKRDVPETRVLFENSCDSILEIAVRMAEGELEYRRGHHERAFALLREAVKLDDSLNYDEPWGWMQPVRHALGALLLEQGQVAAAEKVYRADLERYPKNGWALHGLAECLERQGETASAQGVEDQFARAWQRADVALMASCFCRTGVTDKPKVD